MEKLKKFWDRYMGYIILLGTAVVMCGLVALSWIHTYQSLKNRGKYTVGVVTSDGTDSDHEWWVNGNRYGASN